MTIMTTTFIPCGAKLPFIAMVAGAIFGGASWVAPSAYFLGIGAVIVSGIILKKTKLFAGDPAPFVMELPAYHMPTVGTVLRSMWERGWSFIKKAGTIILLSTIFVWFTTLLLRLQVLWQKRISLVHLVFCILPVMVLYIRTWQQTLPQLVVMHS
jgi:ferrous iron transport protein B